MEPPAKRVRVGHAPWDDDDDDEEANDDELTLSASQFDARQDPMYQLDKKRAKSVFKLKSRFEDIFEKYGKHFEGVGDEIDLRTGEIVINNGHLQSLEDENQDESEDEQEMARVLQEKGAISRPKPAFLVKGRSASGHTSYMPQNGRQQPTGLIPLEVAEQAKLPLFGNSTVDPAWQTPEMQSSSQNGVGLENRGRGLVPLFSDRDRSSLDATGFGIGFGMFDALQRPYRRIAIAKDIVPKPFPVPISDEANQHNDLENDSGDDVLLGTDEKIVVPAARPHLKKPFKVVALPTNGPEKSPNEQKTEPKIKASTTTTTDSSRRSGRPRRKSTSPPRIFGATNAGPLELSGDDTNVARTKTASRASNGNSVTTEKSKSLQDSMQEQTPLVDDSSDSQSRRSGRVRKEVDRYSQIAWANTRRKVDNVMTPPETDTEESLILRQLTSQPVRSLERSVIEKADWCQSDMDASLRDQAAGHVNSITKFVDRTTTIPDSSCLTETEQALLSPEALNPSLLQLPDTDSKSKSLSRLDPSLGKKNDAFDKPLEQNVYLQSSVGEDTDTISVCFNSESLKGPKTQEIIGQEYAVELADQLDTDERVSYAGSVTSSASESEQADLVDCTDADVSVELGEPISSNIVEQSREETSTPIKPSSGSVKTPERDLFFEVGSSSHQPKSPDLVAQKISASSPRVSPQPSSNASTQNDHSETLENQPPEPALANDFSQLPPQPRSRHFSPKSQQKANFGTPKKARVLSSLITDISDDEDQINILSSSVVRTPTSNASLRGCFVRSRSRASSTVKPPPYRVGQQSNPVSSPYHPNISAGSRRYASPSLPGMAGPDTGPIRHGRRREQSTAVLAQSSPLARSLASKTPQKLSHQGKKRTVQVSSPIDASMLTPGGTMRRCGEDGFMCDREFCFTCCK